MKSCHSYGGWFKCFKVPKRNYLHINVLTTREVLWVNLFPNYLTYFWIITCAFSGQNYCVDSQTWNVVYLNNNFSQYKNVANENPIFQFLGCNILNKIQNAAWFQYNTFLCCKFSFIKSFYIHAWRTFF